MEVWTTGKRWKKCGPHRPHNRRGERHRKTRIKTTEDDINLLLLFLNFLSISSGSVDINKLPKEKAEESAPDYKRRKQNFDPASLVGEAHIVAFALDRDEMCVEL